MPNMQDNIAFVKGNVIVYNHIKHGDRINYDEHTITFNLTSERLFHYR